MVFSLQKPGHGYEPWEAPPDLCSETYRALEMNGGTWEGQTAAVWFCVGSRTVPIPEPTVSDGPLWSRDIPSGGRANLFVTALVPYPMTWSPFSLLPQSVIWNHVFVQVQYSASP